MEFQFDNLTKFFDAIRSITFWQRIFRWKAIKNLSYDAYEEFKRLHSSLKDLFTDLSAANHKNVLLEKDIEHLKSEASQVQQVRDELDNQRQEMDKLKDKLATLEEGKRLADVSVNDQKLKIASLEENAKHLTNDKNDLLQKTSKMEEAEQRRKSDYEKAIATLESTQRRHEQDRKDELEEKKRKEIESLESMKATWSRHQEKVKETIKSICQKHTIDYVDKVPFKGNPDNTIKISDEHIIFDAKSPGSEDLGNFWTYIKNQTEAVKKYIKEENVRRDIYLVIPSSTVEVIEQFSHNMADYNVYVVTLDALEPIILSLKKIEDYEFLDQLSPEERENICRVIGRFAHITKRRIQIDQYFAWQFFETLNKSGRDLPEDIVKKVIEFEKSEKLNPPQEKRAKQISIEELTKESKQIEKEAEAKGIAMPAKLSQEIRQMPLYLDEGNEKDS